MMISRGPAVGDVVVLKIAGQPGDVIGRLRAMDDGMLRLHRPLMTMVYATPGSQALAVELVPWSLIAADEEVEIDRRHVIAILRPREDIRNRYTEAVSGLVVPAVQMPGDLTPAGDA